MTARFKEFTTEVTEFTEKISFDVWPMFSVCEIAGLSQHRLGDETLSRIRVLVRRTNKERTQKREVKYERNGDGIGKN
jgi:hypothetical protein